MNLIGTVDHDVIRLPPGLHLPDGTRVQIMLAAEAAPAPPKGDPVFRLGENPVDDPLTDGARHHDAHLER